MSEHKIIRHLLYDYSRGELDPDSSKRVEGHCSSCSECKADLDMMKAATRLISRRADDPSADRSEEFWNSFVTSVETRIRQAELAGARRRPSVWEAIQPWFVFHRPYVATASGALATLIVAFFIWQLLLPHEMEREKPQMAERHEVADTTGERMSKYFRKSKMLLVGLTNMKTIEGRPVDLRIEQELSRKLLQEARLLESQPLDPGATRLIRDLEKIQIELANLNQEVQLPNVEMIRSGIYRKNLLFKTRMAESAYESVRFVSVNEKY